MSEKPQVCLAPTASLTPTFSRKAGAVNILPKPSIDSFLSRDKSSPMYSRPWRKFLAEQDRRFKAQYRSDHPSYECRWAIHQLNQRIYVANMAYFHADLSPAVRSRHERRQRMVVAAMSSALWNAVVFSAKREASVAA